jgi:hypothetical protein
MGKTQLSWLVLNTGLEARGTGMQKALSCWYGLYYKSYTFLCLFTYEANATA